VTTFGAFVDIGVGTCGLVHISKMKRQSLHVNQRIEVQVLDVDVARKRIALGIKNS
jgi:protein Tex